jgi:hypothetical protein
LTGRRSDGKVDVLAATSTTDHLTAGRAALARGAWERARASFDAALALDASAGAWEGRSWAAWWLDDVATCLAARERAYRRYRAGRDPRGAARMALWLGDDHLEFRGEAAVANGWFQRAARLLEGLEPSPEHGWLAVFRAHLALNAHDLAEAQQLGGAARDLGSRPGEVDLEMFGLATEGLAEHNPEWGALADALERHAGPEAGAMMRSPFPDWDAAELRELVTSAGFDHVRVNTVVASARYPSPEDLVRWEAASSPLAGPLGALAPERREALIGEVAAALRDHTDDGVVFPQETHVVLARRP